MDTSSIASLATGLSQARLASDVSTSVAKKTLDSARQEGDAMVELIQKAGSVGKTPGVGESLDTFA